MSEAIAANIKHPIPDKRSTIHMIVYILKFSNNSFMFTLRTLHLS